MGHDSGHNEAGVIAADIVSGTATANEVISLVETGAAKDGAHSADQQLLNVQSALIKDHDNAANNAFVAEEQHRLMDGAAQAGPGQLVNSGDLDFTTARSILSQEVTAANIGSLLNQDLKKEAATGGNNALETQIGELLAAASAESTAEGVEGAIQTVEAAATKSGRSVDQALANLSQGAGVRFEGSASDFIAIDETNRISSGAAAADLALRVEAGRITDT